MTENQHLSFTCYGAAGTTTGSRHLLKIADKQVLLDCGLYQGRRKDSINFNQNFGFDPLQIDKVILSHAHIDHSGNLPNLTKQQYEGPIYCTPATADLCRVMLRDSAFIQQKDAEYLNRRRNKNSKKNKGRKIEPLYNMADAEQCIQQFRSVHYHQPLELFDGRLRSTFYDSGHILGSASIILDITLKGKQRRFAFSGDIGRVGLPLLRDPESPHNVDYLLMEGTYGARTHDDIADAKAEMLEVVQRVSARGGKIIVPSFSVERTQEIVYYLNELHNEGLLPRIPIFVDSPLAINVTEIFRQHYECFDKAFHKTLLEDPDPFGFGGLQYTREASESKALNDIKGSCIIISASGMCEAGRILHHLRNNIEEPRNCIMFVGYQGEGMLGRKIVERHKTVNIYGRPFSLNCEVATLNTMSGHADKNDLFNYAKSVRDASPQLKKVFLVHGEKPGLETLADRLQTQLQLDVQIAEHGVQYELG